MGFFSKLFKKNNDEGLNQIDEIEEDVQETMKKYLQKEKQQNKINPQ